MREIILDAGSTHGNNKDRCLKLIRAANSAGITSLKFQLFPNDEIYTGSGNIALDPVLFKQCVAMGNECGVEVFASVFSFSAIETCLDACCKRVKIAYSQRNNKELIDACSDFEDIIISTDDMTPLHDIQHTRLYCIPQYPVTYLVDFDTLFYGAFDGFSDHTRGINQSIEAMNAGACIIEKHVRLDDCIGCPDERFAITFSQAEQLRRVVDEDCTSSWL